MATDTPTGMQPANANDELGFNFGYNRPWEQNAKSTATAGYIDQSVDPVAHRAWRITRSNANKTKPEYPV